MLVVAASMILLGTLYPLVLDALSGAKLSVGPPYFNALFIPLMGLLMVVMAVGVLVQERAQMIYALSEELSHSVSQIDGIVAARVHVVLPDNDLLKRVISPSSASVLVRYDPGTDINTLIPQIKTLVANGISGLSYDGVSVTAIKAAVAISQNPAQPRLARFMGLWLLEDNLAQARIMFGGLLLIALGALGVLARQQWARRQSQALYVLKEGE